MRSLRSSGCSRALSTGSTDLDLPYLHSGFPLLSGRNFYKPLQGWHSFLRLGRTFLGALRVVSLFEIFFSTYDKPTIFQISSHINSISLSCTLLPLPALVCCSKTFFYSICIGLTLNRFPCTLWTSACHTTASIQEALFHDCTWLFHFSLVWTWNQFCFCLPALSQIKTSIWPSNSGLSRTGGPFSFFGIV